VSPATYDNWICDTAVVKKTTLNPIYYMGSSVSGNAWLQAYKQYEAAWTGYLSLTTNACFDYGLTTPLDYFGSVAVYNCVLFLRSALQTAYPNSTITPFPKCNTATPQFANSVNLTALNQCVVLLTSFVNGQVTIPNCGGVAYAVLVETGQNYETEIQYFADGSSLRVW
jgi:hypothetical protein